MKFRTAKKIHKRVSEVFEYCHNMPNHFGVGNFNPTADAIINDFVDNVIGYDRYMKAMRIYHKHHNRKKKK